MTWAMHRTFIVLALLLCSGAQAMPDIVREQHAPASGWQRWGSAEMTWFGLSIYGATLWVGESGLVQAEGLGSNTPLALSLRYHRDIPGKRIVNASVEEMRSLGASEESLKIWETDMRRLFPDVREGDTLTGVFQPGRGARFFHNEKDLGEVRDVEFARRFFSIWLDPKTSVPEIRTALLRRSAG